MCRCLRTDWPRCARLPCPGEPWQGRARAAHACVICMWARMLLQGAGITLLRPRRALLTPPIASPPVLILPRPTSSVTGRPQPSERKESTVQTPAEATELKPSSWEGRSLKALLGRTLHLATGGKACYPTSVQSSNPFPPAPSSNRARRRAPCPAPAGGLHACTRWTPPLPAPKPPGSNPVATTVKAGGPAGARPRPAGAGAASCTLAHPTIPDASWPCH